MVAFFSSSGLVALITLTFLEIVLGVDNVIFISILASKLPGSQQDRARQMGLLAAMAMRILLLLSIVWIIRLTTPLFYILERPISGRDLILIGGGLFLLAKATIEIHDRLEGEEGHSSARVRPSTKGGTPARLGYYDNYLVDNHSCVIVGVQATAARMSQETVAAQDMLARFATWQGRGPESVAADTTYGNGEFLQWLADRSITPYMRTRDSIHRKRSPFFGPERFTYQPEHNRYICPAGQVLNYGGRVYRNHAFNYIGTRKKCGPCSLRPQCTSAAFRGLIIHQNEPARQRARELANTPEFAKAQRQRKKVEALFAELKNQIGLRRLRLRRIRFVSEQFFLAAVAQNLKRLVRFLSRPKTPVLPATT
jgi:hypothetical protein